MLLCSVRLQSGTFMRAVEKVWLRIMVSFHIAVFAGLFTCIVPVPLLHAQSSANLPSPSPSGQVAPSDSAVQSGPVSQSTLVAGKKNTSKSSSASSTRGMLASGSVTGESQDVCFQLGVGWQRLPQTAVNSARQTSAVGSNTATQGAGSTIGGNPSTLNILPSGANQSDQCPGIMISSTPPGAVVGTMVAGKQSQNSSMSVQEFETHAYISPIKLRRMMRNAPDLETRLKLREISGKQKKGSSKSVNNQSLRKVKGNQSSNNTSSNTRSDSQH
jgi:hypothetical protein